MQCQVDYISAVASKYPEQIVIGIARDSQGKYNPITLGWTTIVSHKPPMMAVAIGKTRHSLKAFRHAREFVIAFPSEYQKDEAMLFGTKSGRDVDKLAVAGCPTTLASRIDSVLLTEAVANFECNLASELETGDHVVFVGEVICSHLNDKPLNRLYTVGEGFVISSVPRG